MNLFTEQKQDYENELMITKEERKGEGNSQRVSRVFQLKWVPEKGATSQPT